MQRSLDRTNIPVLRLPSRGVIDIKDRKGSASTLCYWFDSRTLYNFTIARYQKNVPNRSIDLRICNLISQLQIDGVAVSLSSRLPQGP